MANISSPLEIFSANICVIANTDPANITRYWSENTPTLLVIIKNQNDNPADTASALNLGDEVCILNGINESD